MNKLQILNCQFMVFITSPQMFNKQQKKFGWLVGFYLHHNHCRLFNDKSFLYIYILNIYDLVWLGFMAYQPL